MDFSPRPWKRRALLCGALSGCLSLLPTGCARFPESDAGANQGKVLVVNLQFRGAIDINRQPRGNYYFVVINRTDNATEPGPAPVVSLPWGNGFAGPPAIAPNSQGFVGFVRYDREQGGIGGFGVYSAAVNGVLQNPVNNVFTPLGPPDRVTQVQAGDTNLSFQLDLSRLPNPNARYVQINVIATNNTPQGAEDAPKIWDALGDGSQTGSLSNWVTIDTTQNPTITNEQQVGIGREPQGDVRDHLGPLVDDASLDVVNWTFQVRDP